MLRQSFNRNKTIFLNIKMCEDIFKIYTDGACTNNGKLNARCSIGVYFSDKNTVKLKDISKVLQVEKSSNNVAELTAIYEALKIYQKSELFLPLQIYSDSKYSINCITKWYPSWVLKDCVQSKENHKLIKDIYDKYSEMKKNHDIHLQYIKAHTGFNDEHSIGNSIADRLATDALKKFDKPRIDIRKFFQDDTLSL